MKVLVLSGIPATGKTTLANNICRKTPHSSCFSTSSWLKTLTVEKDRNTLIAKGDLLDKETGGEWIVKGILTYDIHYLDLIIIDRIRKKEHIQALRNQFGENVFHVHLIANIDTIKERLNGRNEQLSAIDSDSLLSKELEKIANLVIHTDDKQEDCVATIVAAHININPLNPYVDILVGGQYGSEGKGHIASFIAHEYDVLVRSGGPNAGHQVYGDPVITFHHLPSGSSRNLKAPIILAAGSIINVQKLRKELEITKVNAGRLMVDENATIIDDEDIKREQELQKKIGSTAQGVGSAAARRILRSLANPQTKLAKDDPFLSQYVCDTKEALGNFYAEGKKILAEGTQGSALSLYHGPYPYVTSRDTNAAGLMAETGIAPAAVRRVIMVCRTFPIRVQSPNGETSGPMTGETNWDVVAQSAKVDENILKNKEITSTTKRQRRVAHFDWELLKRSSLINMPTDIALTFADYLSDKNAQASRFEQLTIETKAFIKDVEMVSNSPVSFVSVGFRWGSIIDCRTW